MQIFISRGDSKGFWTFDTEETVLEKEEYEFEGKYYKYLNLRICCGKNGNTEIGNVLIYCFHMDAIELDGENLVDIADSINQEVYDAINVVSAIDLLPGYVWERPVLCYLETLYINPEFRGKGIGSWILKNLHELITFYYDTEAYGFVTYPRPSDGHDDSELLEEIIKLDPMYQHMVDLLERNEFKRIDETNYFFRNCSGISN